MDGIRKVKLQRVVFERLTVGESRESLIGELCRRLDAIDAQEIVNSAVDDITEQRAQGTYEATAKRIRKHRLFGPDLAWKNLGFLLLIGGGLFMAVNLLTGTPAIAFGPILAGFLILVVVEPRINAKTAEANAAVDRLFEASGDA